MENARVILDLKSWQGFVIIVVALLGLFILVGNAVKTYRELKKPRDAEEMCDREKLAKIVLTLDKHETEIEDLRKGLTVMCQASQALLNHSIHNGNTGEMEKASSEIDKYLRNKI